MRRGGGEDLGSDPYQFIYTNDQLRRGPQQLHVFHLRSKPALRCVHRCPIPNGVARVCHHPACGRHGYKTIVLLLTQKPVYGGSRTCTHPTPIAKSSSTHARRSCAPRNWVRRSDVSWLAGMAELLLLGTYRVVRFTHRAFDRVDGSLS